MRSRPAIQRRCSASLAWGPNGALSSAVIRPLVSVTAMGMPRRRTSAASARSASAVAPSRGSFRPAKTWPSSRLVSRASLRRCRETTQAYPTDRTPNTNAVATSAVGPARRRALLPPAALLGEAVSADIRHQHRRDGHRAIGLLMCLEQRGGGARQRDTGGVERVHEFRLLPGTGPAPNIRAARLIVGVRTGARYFEPLSDARGPHFEIIGLGGGESKVIRRQYRDAIRQLELLQDGFGVRGQLLVLGRRVGRSAEAHELDLVELMHAQQPARVFPGGTRLAAETGRVGDISLRQRRPIEDFVAVEVGDGNLRRR